MRIAALILLLFIAEYLSSAYAMTKATIEVGHQWNAAHQHKLDKVKLTQQIEGLGYEVSAFIENKGYSKIIVISEDRQQDTNKMLSDMHITTNRALDEATLMKIRELQNKSAISTIKGNEKLAEAQGYAIAHEIVGDVNMVKEVAKKQREGNDAIEKKGEELLSMGLKLAKIEKVLITTEQARKLQIQAEVLLKESIILTNQLTAKNNNVRVKIGTSKPKIFFISAICIWLIAATLITNSRQA